MLDIPYVPNTGNSCALSCYTMAAKYFFPETSFEDLAKVTRHVPKYVIWEMPFWNWIMDRGITVTSYSTIDYGLWAEEGTDGLKKMVGEKEFEYYQANTYDLESYTEDISENLANPLFVHMDRNPTWGDLLAEFAQGAVCNIVLNFKALDREDGFALHQVVVLDITDEYIEFHDPRTHSTPRPNRRESYDHFRYAWLETVDNPSLCTYKKV